MYHDDDDSGQAAKQNLQIFYSTVSTKKIYVVINAKRSVESPDSSPALIRGPPRDGTTGVATTGRFLLAS
jgi:hypothetical protein